MEWMHLTHGGVRFGAALNVVMNRVTGRGYGSWRQLILAYVGGTNVAVGEYKSSYSRGPGFKYRPRYLVVLTRVFSGFPPYLKVNCRLLHRIISISLYSIHSEIHWPLIYAVSAMKSAVLTAESGPQIKYEAFVPRLLALQYHSHF